MPLYDYKCACGQIETMANTVDNRRTHAPIHCDEQMSINISGSHHIAPILGGGSMPGYQCPITDKFVTSRKERQYIMDSNNVIETG